MPTSAAVECRRRGEACGLLVIGLVLAIGLAGCIPSSNGAADPGTGGDGSTLDTFARGYGLPGQSGFDFYWYSQAWELRPIEQADAILAGTVEAVAPVRETTGHAFGRVVSGWLTEAQFRVVCSLRGDAQAGDRVSITYFTPKETDYGGLSSGRGLSPETLGPGVSYLLLLGGPPFHVGRSGDPPPIPLAPLTAGVPSQGGAPEAMATLLIASARSTEPDLRRYAIPVLGYLAAFCGQEGARVAVAEMAESDEESIAATAFRALTAWGQYAEGDLRALTAQSHDDSSMVSGLAIAGRIRRHDLAVFSDLIAWCRRAGLPASAAGLIGRELKAWPRQQLSEELIGQWAELLEHEVPVAIRAGVIDVVWDAGGVEVVPLFMKAINDPDPDVAYVAMLGLCSATDGGIEAGQRGADVRVHLELLPGPVSPDEFRADPQRIAGLWNKWWAQASQDGWPPPPPPEAPGPPVQGPPPG